MNHTYLIDSSIYIYRAWHIMPQTLLNGKDQPVNALLGFSDFICEFMEQIQPKQVAFAFDETTGKSTRQAIDPYYKANRPAAAEALVAQFPMCREFVNLLGLANASSDKHEADDVLATWAKQEREKEQFVHVLSADKDLMQLVVSPRDTWWDYARNRRWTTREVEKNWGVRPDQIADLLAIAGDKADNIQGIPGIGPTIAARLLRKFGSLESMLEQRESISKMKTRGAHGLQEMVCKHVDNLRLARRLTGLVEDVELPRDMNLAPANHDDEKLQEFFMRNGFDDYRIRRWERVLR